MAYRNPKYAYRRSSSRGRSAIVTRERSRSSYRSRTSLRGSPVVRWSLAAIGLLVIGLCAKPAVAVLRVVFGSPMPAPHHDGGEPVPAPSESSRFAEVDGFVTALPESDGRSVRTLVEALGKVPGGGSANKVRAAYIWVARNIQFDYGRMEQTLPDEVLSSRRAVCAGYTQLLEAICKGLEIECPTINGVVPESMRTNNGEIAGHAWNVVKLDGRRLFLDVTWASTTGNYDDFFLVSPEQFIFSHFPEGVNWQFLDKPWSRRQFDSLPAISPPFFRLGWQLESHLDRYIRETDKRLVFKIDPSRPTSRVNVEIHKVSNDAAISDSEPLYTSNGRIPDEARWEILLNLERFFSHRDELKLVIFADDEPLNSRKPMPQVIEYRLKR